jgi:hypothetical protein
MGSMSVLSVGSIGSVVFVLAFYGVSGVTVGSVLAGSLYILPFPSIYQTISAPFYLFSFLLDLQAELLFLYFISMHYILIMHALECM